MREIKFRGWNIYKDSWIYGDLITLQASPLSQIFEGRDSSEDGLGTDAHPDSIGQFTGLKDKNGVEIFEGDIVEMKHWEPSRWLVDYSNEIGGFYFRHRVERPYDTCHPMRYLEKASVIGNIHENPELLDA